MLCEGDIIIPPCNAADVTIRDLDLTRIEILRKRPNPLQKGCWDIELKYVFNYTLEFRRADGCFIGTIDATSSHHLRVTLFGSTEADDRLQPISSRMPHPRADRSSLRRGKRLR